MHRNRIMRKNLLARHKNTLRLLAWTGLIAVVWAIWQDTALAEGVMGAAEPEEGNFVTRILRSIFLFDTRALMETLSKPEYAISAFIALNVIVFVETGLLIGFFLPGDSLLVITGLICANESCGWNMPLLLVTLCLSAIIGDSVGYGIGYKTGPKIFNRDKSLLFNKDHLLKAQAFYEKHGGKTIILARFMPILRTFAPVVAGVGKMDYQNFLFFNVIGGVSWVVSMVLAGRYLPELLNPLLRPMFGPRFHIADHIEKVVIIVVLLSITPMIFAWIKSKLGNRATPPKPESTSRTEALIAR
jgi:membrane-associated protein